MVKRDRQGLVPSQGAIERLPQEQTVRQSGEVVVARKLSEFVPGQQLVDQSQ